LPPNPTPQSTIPNPQSPLIKEIFLNLFNYFIKLLFTKI